MDQKKKLMMVALVAGGVLLVGAWIFLLSTMLGGNDTDTQLTADIQQDAPQADNEDTTQTDPADTNQDTNSDPDENTPENTTDDDQE
jgi:flagellar basal body-associated protein FliL